MNLKQLEAFVQVAEGKSFSKAAKELFLTQPTVSAHISSLEKELGVRLLVRNTKEVALSDSGQELYRYARQIVDLEERIDEIFKSKQNVGKHSITIAASTIPAQYLVPEILIKFQEKHPEEQIKLIADDSAGVVEQVVSHAVEIGFTGTVLDKKNCKYIPFYKDTLVIITPNTPKYQEIKANHPEDVRWLLEENVIMREEGSGTRKEAEKQLKKAGIPVQSLNIIASMDNQETIKRSVRQGMGISILSQLATKVEVEDGYLLAHEIPGADDGRDLNLIYNKNKPLSRSAERFIKVVKSIYEI